MNCEVINCEYNHDQRCDCCDDYHDPSKSEECISFVDKAE